MEAASELYTKKVLRSQKFQPGVTERMYNVLLLVAQGYCTTQHIHYAAKNLNIVGKAWNDTYGVLRKLEELGLINYNRGLLIPYRGKELSIISCKSEGYAFISKIFERTKTLASNPVNPKDVKSILRKG